jgi:hypothetical protein
MLTALNTAREKLSEYYKRTDGANGDLFAIRTILVSSNKLQFFTTSNWKGEWHERYHQSMREYFEPYQKRVLENQSSFGSNTLSVQTTELDMALQTKPRDTCLSKPTQQNELT